MQIWMAWALAFFLCIATPAQAMSASKALANPLATKLDTHYFPINNTDPDGLKPVKFSTQRTIYIRDASTGLARPGYKLGIKGVYETETGQIDVKIFQKNLSPATAEVKVDLDFETVRSTSEGSSSFKAPLDYNGDPNATISVERRLNGFNRTDAYSGNEDVTSRKAYVQKIPVEGKFIVNLNATYEVIPVGTEHYTLGGLRGRRTFKISEQDSPEMADFLDGLNR